MIRATLAELFAFLRRPVPMAASGLNADGAIGRWLVLAAFQLGVLGLVVMPLVALWQKAFALSPPDAFEGLGPLALWGGAVLLAPVLEELFFRGWMSGTRRVLALMGVVVAGLLLFIAFGRGKPLVGGGILLATVAVAAGLWWRMRRDKAVPDWFSRHFALLIYGTTAIFAAMHLFNYPTITLVAVPMVLPQFWSGLMFAHIRVRLGLLASILNHIASNAIVLAVALSWG
ncbi:CPBP family glutamic-type intramembrane protease [Novosphingobium jiangmenense]|uniref:CPBP family intramembrane metalloprotease n=1 Tax=Novosphingobium jiangmenense TaxID=2791981 RepID=A0ABS0HG52_9SPHN|nr:CPBP family glutamic-type intramembrane protease [Novosphingobium jiangmenense]MBF9151231.1 CPBP family intramembrane metalloprotease [Novosphingobium jiangmenense]